MKLEPDPTRVLSRTYGKFMLDVARGLTAQESADRHNVSIHTVYAVQKRVKYLLGAQTISQAAVLALLNGNYTEDEVRNQS